MQVTYIVQPFNEQVVKGRSKLVAAAPMQFNREEDAVRRAGRMAEKHAGVVAVAQEYDEESGEMGKTTVVAQYGQTPEELLEGL